MRSVLKKSRVLVNITLLMVATLLVGPAMAMAQTDATSEAEVTNEPLTILLMISDARDGEEIESGATDVMAVVHLNPDQEACRALNILPTTRVEIADVGNTRISQAMSQGGIEQATQTVEEYLGIEIDHYGVVDLDGVIGAIDAIGGITVNNPEAFSVGGNEFPAGEITLSGEQALIFARQGGQEDAQTRLNQQKALVEGLVGSLGNADPSAGLPAAMQGSVTDLQDHVLTDIDLETAVAIASAYSTCRPDTETVNTIPFVEEGALLDDVTQQEEISGTTDPAVVQQYTDWLINGTELPQQ